MTPIREVWSSSVPEGEGALVVREPRRPPTFGDATRVVGDRGMVAGGELAAMGPTGYGITTRGTSAVTGRLLSGTCVSNSCCRY